MLTFSAITGIHQNIKTLGTENIRLIPLDVDFVDADVIFVEAKKTELNSLLRVSALDFPLKRLRAIPMVKFNHAAESIPNLRNINFLFHLPFSGSTFLTRFLEAQGAIFYRDPACLDALFQAVRDDDSEMLLGLRQSVLKFLSKSHDDVIWIRTAGYRPRMFKPLTMGGHCQFALFLYDELDCFLLQVLKEKRRCEDLKYLILEQAEYFLTEWGVKVETLCPAKYIALFWLNAVHAFCTLPLKQKAVLCSSGLYQDPIAVTKKIQKIYGAETYQYADIENIINKHSKTGAPFSNHIRTEKIMQNRHHFDVELKTSRKFANGFSKLNLEASLAELELR